MKKITLKLNVEQLHYYAEYLCQATTWTEGGLRLDDMSVMQKLLMISTGSILRKMAINAGARLLKEGKIYRLPLDEGKAEALYAFFIIEAAPYPSRIRNEILIQFQPAFPYDIDVNDFKNLLAAPNGDQENKM